MNRRTLLLTVGVAAPVGAALGWGASEFVLGRRSPPPAPRSPFGQTIGTPFTLTDHAGRRVTDRDYAGTVRVVFFGFTHCPDVCPTAMNYITEAFEQLDTAETGRVRGLLISVDAERDTPAVMRDYVANFHPAMVGLSGSQQDVDGAVRAFGSYARRVPTEGGGYTMDHTASIYLLDGEGRLRGFLDNHEPIATAVAKLRLALHGPAGAASGSTS